VDFNSLNDINSHPSNEDYLKFHINKDIKNLFKSFLSIIEELEKQGYIFSESDRKIMRKKILDKGNDTIRELEEEIDKFNFSLKIK
jgi:DNA-binding PadR family transcriptional regulator